MSDVVMREQALGEEKSRWEIGTEQLVDLYRDIERKSLNFPFISFMPLLIFIWNYLKFYFFLIVGPILIIPVNLVIFIRNLFPGHWNYQWMFLRYIGYVLAWLWRGEALQTPFVFFRPLTRMFLIGHFRRRMKQLRRLLRLADGISEEKRQSLIGVVNDSLGRWKSQGLSFSLASIPAALGPALLVYEILEKTGAIEKMGEAQAQEMVTSTLVVMGIGVVFVAILLFFVAPAFLIQAFVAKRGIMLDREGHGAYFPGGVGGKGHYGTEHEILTELGIRHKEPSIDLWLVLIFLGITSAYYGYIGYGLSTFDPDAAIGYFVIMFGLYILPSMLLLIFVWWRRAAAVRK